MLPRFLLVAGISTLISSVAFCADAKPEVYTDPSQAGPDFAVQGEYTGDNCAAQVVALGDGKFHIVGWGHGLPGAVSDFEKKVEVDARREGDKVVFDGNGWKGEIVGAKLNGTNEKGNSWSLEKTERKSPTLGEKPPQGATVLFDGSNADAWKGKMENGLLVSGATSKQAFGDCTIHVEYRIPFKPAARGQERGNSGVYVQNRYECQVLDSFGLKGEDNELGGIYHVSKPKLNMAFPPLSWQTYDIDFEAAKWDAEGKKTKNAVLTVKLNGVLVQDHVEVPGPTPGGSKETTEAGPIYLQSHGNPVYFRNIWVVEKK